MDVRMNMKSIIGLAAVAGLSAAAWACGGSGGGGNPTGPSGPTVGSTGSVGAIGATITIANGAVSPSQVTVGVGQSVRFVNSDGRSHDVSSDPHPTHTNCPSIANVGAIASGQTKDTQGFSGAGSCGFHDHNDPDNNALKGRITIQ
jgi:plastocyanin